MPPCSVWLAWREDLSRTEIVSGDVHSGGSETRAKGESFLIRLCEQCMPALREFGKRWRGDSDPPPSVEGKAERGLWLEYERCIWRLGGFMCKYDWEETVKSWLGAL